VTDAPLQPVLPEFDTRAARRARKEVREVSRAQYAELRDHPWLTQRTHAVLTALAHRYYVTQAWPTAGELCRWMFRHHGLKREAINVVAPRLSDLVNGRWVTEGGVRRRVGGGVCELLPKRRCTVTGGLAHPIRIREAGSILAHYGYGGRA
jgi:hypothetical protein